MGRAPGGDGDDPAGNEEDRSNRRQERTELRCVAAQVEPDEPEKDSAGDHPADAGPDPGGNPVGKDREGRHDEYEEEDRQARGNPQAPAAQVPLEALPDRAGPGQEEAEYAHPAAERHQPALELVGGVERQIRQDRGPPRRRGGAVARTGGRGGGGGGRGG